MRDPCSDSESCKAVVTPPKMKKLSGAGQNNAENGENIEGNDDDGVDDTAHLGYVGNNVSAAVGDNKNALVRAEATDDPFDFFVSSKPPRRKVEIFSNMEKKESTSEFTSHCEINYEFLKGGLILIMTTKKNRPEDHVFNFHGYLD